MENKNQKVDRGSDMEEFEIEYSIRNHRIGGDNIINVPFRDVFDNNPKCKNYLFEDFCSSVPRPNLRLFMRKYFSDEKIRLEFNKNEENISLHESQKISNVTLPVYVSVPDFEIEYREKHKEFFRLVDEDKLARKYYLPFLPETKTLVTLSKVNSIVDAIKEKPFIIPNDDIQNYCKIQADEIIDILNSLQLPELKRGVIKSIINDNYNGLLFFEGMERTNGEIIRRKDGDDATFIWNYMKESLNGLLKKEIASSYERVRSEANKQIDAFFDIFIPEHIVEEYRNELKHVLSYGKVDKKLINWKTGHPELFKYLKPFFDDETIPHLHSDNWIDFALNNFTLKGNLISKKSLQNENTRKNW